MSKFEVIAFDGDDTLWHNERLFVQAQAEFRALLAGYRGPEWIAEGLAEAESHNLQHFGYGIKGFALSMIETAVELTEGRISGQDIRIIVDIAKRMLAAEVELLDHAEETVASLSETYRLMLVTKGDLHDQEKKIARSGIGQHFRHVEIVSEKRTDNYAALLKKHAIAPDRFLMIGNSLRSDILPVLELGGSAVYIPHDLTWSHERADPPPEGQPGYYELKHIGLVPELLRALEREPLKGVRAAASG